MLFLRQKKDRPRKTRRRYRLLAVFGAALLLVLGTAFLFALSQRASPIRLADPDFIATTPPSGPPPPAGFWGRLSAIPWTSLQRLSTPASWSFSPRAEGRDAMHGLLNQCMEISGTQYYLHRDIAAAQLQFGHSNVLNGYEWIAAIENAIENGQLNWYDSQTGRMRTESLVLHRLNSRTVLVAPREFADFKRFQN